MSCVGESMRTWSTVCGGAGRRGRRRVGAGLDLDRGLVVRQQSKYSCECRRGAEDGASFSSLRGCWAGGLRFF